MAESEEELKSLLMKVKEESEKAGLKLNIQKTKIMASGAITSWQIDGETIETVTDFIFLGSKITADGDCSHEIKRDLLLARKAMTNLESILKSKDITLPTKIHLVKTMVFPVVIYGCESWTTKAEHQRIDAFELWCWRRLLRVPWNARRSNQSILKEISPEYSLEGLMLKLKLQYFGYLMWRADSLEKTKMLERLKAEGEGDNRGLDGWMASPTWWTSVWASPRRWWRIWTAAHGVAKSWTWLSDWTTQRLNNKEIESVSKNLPMKESPDQMPHSWILIKHLKIITSILLKLFQKIKELETLPSSLSKKTRMPTLSTPNHHSTETAPIRSNYRQEK